MVVSYSYFGVDGDGIWLGVVGKWKKYVGSDFNEYYGYEILYDLGDKYNMIEADVYEYLADGDVRACVSESSKSSKVVVNNDDVECGSVIVLENDRNQLGLDI